MGDGVVVTGGNGEVVRTHLRYGKASFIASKVLVSLECEKWKRGNKVLGRLGHMVKFNTH
jgi:hypothetical protein